MRTTTLKLTRWWGPSKTVAVGPITVSGYMGLVQYAATRAAEVRLRSTKDITGEDLIRAMRLPDWCLFADLICVGQRPGFFEKWFTERNVRALLAASAVANQWDRIFASLNLDPKAPPRRGSLMDDVVTLCKLMPGQSISEVLEMPMEAFLDLVDTLSREAHAMDPTGDPDAVASEAVDLLMVPGLAVVH